MHIMHAFDIAMASRRSATASRQTFSLLVAELKHALQREST